MVSPQKVLAQFSPVAALDFPSLHVVNQLIIHIEKATWKNFIFTGEVLACHH